MLLVQFKDPSLKHSLSPGGHEAPRLLNVKALLLLLPVRTRVLSFRFTRLREALRQTLINKHGDPSSQQLTAVTLNDGSNHWVYFGGLLWKALRGRVQGDGKPKISHKGH